MKTKLTIIIFLIFPVFVLAQSDGSIPDPASSPLVTETPVSATAAPVPAVSAPRTTTPPPTPFPTVSVSPPSSAPTGGGGSSPLVTPTTTPRPTPLPDESENTIFLILGGIAGAGVLGYLVSLTLRKNKKPEKEDNKCDSIRELLEKKKKELEDSIRKWPEEKLKSMAQSKIIGELKKDENAGKIIETAEILKAKHDKLKETIELLQKRYDLCTLSLPGVEGANYKGTIVENSLKDKGILKNLEIIKNYQMEDWVLNDVLVNEKQIDKLGQHLDDGPWYMNFWQDGKDDMIVVFKEKRFKIKYSDKTTWKEAVEFGKSKDIPEEQLDFKIK